MTYSFYIINIPFKDFQKVLLSLILINFLKWTPAYSQRSYSTFSTIQEISVGKSSYHLVSGDFNGDGLTDIGSYYSKYLSLNYSSEDSIGWRVKNFILDIGIDKCSVEDFNKDGTSDIAVLVENPPLLKIYLTKQHDTLIYKWKYNLSQNYDEIHTSDINNDGKKDILLYGRNFLGITVFLGIGDGTFKYPQTLLPDYSFSFVTTYDFNNDNLMDIFAINWINNEVQLFTSYAKLKYSLPSSLTFPDEPMFITPTYIDSDENLDVIVTFKEKPILQTFLGDGFGGFNLFQNLALLNSADKILAADINNTSSVDILLMNKDKKYLSFWIKDTHGDYVERTIYSAGKNPTDYLLFQIPNSPFYNLAITNFKENKIWIVNNSNNPIEKTNIMKYITGLTPSNVTAVGILNSGYFDLVVSNEGSKSISYFQNKGDGTFEGNIDFQLAAEYPRKLKVVRKDSNSFIALTLHEHLPKISITEVKLNDYSHSTFSLSGFRAPEIVDVILKKPKYLLNIKIANRENESNYIKIFEYNQITKTRFTEAELHTTAKILGCISFDLNKDGFKDNIYVDEKGKNHITLCVDFLNENNVVSKNKCFFSMKDTLIEKVVLFKNDINNDSRDDIIMYSPNSLELLFSLNIYDTSFALPHQRIKNIKINSIEDVQFADLDNDKKIDLVIANAHTKRLQAFFGKGDGSFLPPRRLMGIEGVSGIAIKDFDKDGIPDYAITYENEGYIKIIYGQR